MAYGRLDCNWTESYGAKIQCWRGVEWRRIVRMTLEESPPTGPAEKREDELPLPRSYGESMQTAHLVAVGELVSAITHDLRQPLTALSMNVSAAIAFLNRPAPAVDEALESLNDALRQERRMRDELKILQDLAARREPQRGPVDMTMLVSEVAALVQSDAVARQVPIDLKIVAPVPIISGDAMLIRQATLDILLDGLRRASLNEPGARQMLISVRRDGDTVEVAVTPAVVKTDPSTRDTWRLAVARAAVDVHQATITLDNDPATGVRLVTRWPINGPALRVESVSQ
jgi:signal transduction histidine kinase